MLSLLTAILQVAAIILDYLRDKQQIDAGRAAQIKDNLDASQALLKDLKTARSDASAKHDARGGVPDDKDPYLRD